nr:MAG TPA: Calcineurin-like phosphoesterase [Caudoviricetes sp.]
MEFRHISLVICGHKHTYTCTFQLRENYKYGS